MQLLRAIAMILAPLVLTGCFLTPGQFDSALTVGRDGSFAYSYRGEIILALPDDGSGGSEDAEAMYADIEPICYEEYPSEDAPMTEDGDAEAWMPTERECTPEEAEQQREEYRQTLEASRESERQQAEMMMRMLGGIDIGDEETMRAYAARLERQAGWNSVVYRGDGVFEVEYEISGSLDHGFVFPVLDGFEISQPMVVVTRRDDGSVHVRAPGFAGDDATRLGPWLLAGMGAAPDASDAGSPSRANGRFVVSTDGEIRTNNTEDGPSREGGRSVLTWVVGGLSRPKPEALIQTGR